MNLFRLLVIVQSSYTLITALWPLISIKSFIAITGPKTDIWLVKTVGALLIPVAIALGSHLYIKTDHRPAVLLGCLSAVAFSCIDFYYSSKDVIPDVYQVDGCMQVAFLTAWVFVILTKSYEK